MKCIQYEEVPLYCAQVNEVVTWAVKHEQISLIANGLGHAIHAEYCSVYSEDHCKFYGQCPECHMLMRQAEATIRNSVSR